MTEEKLHRCREAMASVVPTLRRSTDPGPQRIPQGSAKQARFLVSGDQASAKLMLRRNHASERERNREQLSTRPAAPW